MVGKVLINPTYLLLCGVCVCMRAQNIVGMGALIATATYIH